MAAATMNPYGAHHLMSRDDPIHCQTMRAPDYYGLGVRLGIYCAWFQAYIANTMLPSEIAGAADTNAIFLLTLTVAMIKCSSTGMLEQIDGLILMHLSGGTIFGVLTIWGYRTRQYIDNGPRGIFRFGGIGTHARIVVSLAVSCFGLWFWALGVTGALVNMGGPGDDTVYPASNPPECATLYTFMFAKVRADGGIRIFYILVCALCIAYFGIMILASTIAGWTKVSRIISLAKARRWAESSRLRFATGLKYRELELVYKALRVLNLLWLVCSILLVELSLNFNHVTGVLGGPHDNELHLPSQMLPLLIGACGLVRISYLVLMNTRSPEDGELSQPSPMTPRAARTMHFGSDLSKVFSPAMAREAVLRSAHDPEDIDEGQRRRSWAVRYLVAWLPWLSLLRHFGGEESLEAGTMPNDEAPTKENLLKGHTVDNKAE